MNSAYITGTGFAPRPVWLDEGQPLFRLCRRDLALAAGYEKRAQLKNARVDRGGNGARCRPQILSQSRQNGTTNVRIDDDVLLFDLSRPAGYCAGRADVLMVEQRRERYRRSTQRDDQVHLQAR